MISTRDLALLPDVNNLRAVLQSLAMLDAILAPSGRPATTRSTHAGPKASRWAPCETAAAMTSSPCSTPPAASSRVSPRIADVALRPPPEAGWPGVLDGIPAEFADCLRSRHSVIEDTTFCICAPVSGWEWHVGPSSSLPGADPDGSESLLSALDGLPATYKVLGRGLLRAARASGGGSAGVRSQAITKGRSSDSTPR